MLSNHSDFNVFTPASINADGGDFPFGDFLYSPFVRLSEAYRSSES